MTVARRFIAGSGTTWGLRPGYLFSEVFDLKPTSGLSHAQSWLKNQAHLSNFLK